MHAGTYLLKLQIDDVILGRNGQAFSGTSKETIKTLKVQSCKLRNDKYMIASTQINTETFAFIAILVFKLLSRKLFFINRKDNRNC